MTALDLEAPVFSAAGDGRAEQVRRAAAGDAEAFGSLAERAWPALIPLARGVLLKDGDAEDCVQEALLAAWRALPTLRDPEAFDAWLRRIAVRLALRRARAESRSDLEACEPAAPPPDPASLDIPRLLAQLSPRQRTVFYLSAVEGYTDSEIANLIGGVAATVRVHRHRARRRLRALLETLDAT
ncbi:MAG: RNA polymerase sigma factor [Thermoanaerobaculia bacterium]